MWLRAAVLVGLGLVASCSHRERVAIPKSCSDEPFVLVLGHVKSPGKMGVERNAKVLDVVTASGGYDVLAYPEGTTLTRHTCDGTMVKVRVPLNRVADGMMEDVAVAPGDIIMIPSRDL